MTEGVRNFLEEKSAHFHSTVAKMLWVMKRSRQDIETSIYFLCTRLKDRYIHDWGKLRRVLQFLSHTIGGDCVIGADNLYEVLTYVGASYSTHDNMRGRIGGCMTVTWGLIHAKFSKKKLNTKILTESEVVGASDYIPFSIWLAIYMEHKGYTVKRNQPMQDILIAMKMEKNGRNSCTGNYRHISIRYFFVKDRANKVDIEIVHCPTKVMVVNYFTKPLYGRLFPMFREVIMVWKNSITLQ